MNTKIFLIIICLMVCTFGFAFSEGDSDKFAGDVLNNFKNNEYEPLYAKMSSEAKKVMPYNQMVEFFKLEKEILGELTRYEKLDGMQQMIQNRPVKTFRYAAYFTNTGAIIVVTIIEESGKLTCQKLHVDSLIFSKPEVQKRFEALSFN